MTSRNMASEKGFKVRKARRFRLILGSISNAAKYEAVFSLRRPSPAAQANTANSAKTSQGSKNNEPLVSKKGFRRNRARLIQKIYEVDPLLCPKCGGAMCVISVIEEKAVIEKILKHLGLWLINSRAPPRSRVCEDEGIEQPAPDDFFSDPDHSWEYYL